MCRQTKYQREQRLALAHEIRAAGVPIYIPEGDEAEHEPDVSVYQTGGFADSAIFDFYGRAAVTLRIVITMMRGGFAIAEFGLELPWNDRVDWLPDPRPLGSNEYRFSPQHEFALPWREVLNHRANVRHVFRRGGSLAGDLLGTTNEPLPDDLRHGATVRATLVIYDQFWAPHRFPVRLWADRSSRPASRDTRDIGRRTIFDERDRPARGVQASRIARPVAISKEEREPKAERAWEHQTMYAKSHWPSTEFSDRQH